MYETTDFSDRHGAAASSPARRLRLYLPLLMALLTLQCHGTVDLQPPALLPPFEQLPSQWDLPEALITMSGKEVTTPQAWWTVRRPEIEQLFAHYMYGAMPGAPEHVEASLERIDPEYFGGTATKKRLTIRFGPQGAPPIHLLLIVPNDRTGPAPVFLGLNFYGNHSVLDDPEIPLSEVWLPSRAAGVKRHRATEAARGTAAWPIDLAIERGYAVATFYHGDVDPDWNDFSNGIHPHYFQEGQTERGPHDWGTVAAWAWGLHRAVDYLVTDRDIDAGRIALMGHSRNGKAALLAGALDERIAMVISNQSGCGGAALSRRSRGETVAAINITYPHWFCLEFHKFSRHEEMLPFDQHMLVALVAPRPVLVASAAGDWWADPKGEFLSLKGADPVYMLLGAEGLQADAMPPVDTLLDGVLGYHIRPGDHGVGADDWAVFMDYADRNL